MASRNLTGAVSHPASKSEDLHRRHQQGADGPLSRRRRDRAPALRSSDWSTRWRASSAAIRSSCDDRTSSPRPNCLQHGAGMRLDTGDYLASLDTARDMIDLPAIRARQGQA